MANNPQDNNSDHERRRSPRVYATFVEYAAQDLPAKKISTFTKNISACGICILISGNIKIGTILLLKIHLFDSGKAIETKGKVVWIKPSSMLGDKDRPHFEAGIEYVDINKEDYERILRYVIKSLNVKNNY